LGEWGWSTCIPPCTPGLSSIMSAKFLPSVISEEVQAKFLARQWLVNALADIPISIYYDFENDGSDPKSNEDNFGTVEYLYYNESVPHIPKPAYQAALLLQKTLADLKVIRRVDSSDPDAFVLAFGPKDSNTDEIYAIWKAFGSPVGTCDGVTAPVDCGFFGITQQQCLDRGCCFQIPAPSGPQCYFHNQNTTGNIQFRPITAGCFSVLDIYGNTVTSNLCTNDGSLTILGTDSPVYLNRKKTIYP